MTIEITPEMVTLGYLAYSRADHNDIKDDFADGLTAVLPLIEAQLGRDPYAAQTEAYAKLLEQHAAALSAPVPTPEPTASDLRFRALHLAVEHGKHAPEYTDSIALRVAERFRKYLETGSTTNER